MPYTIQPLDGLPVPVLVTRLSAPINVTTEFPNIVAEINARLARFEGDPAYLIADLTGWPPRMSDMLSALSWIAGADTPIDTSYIFNDRVQVIVVNSTDLLEVAANALRHEAFGRKHIWTARSFEDALGQIRQKTFFEEARLIGSPENGRDHTDLLV